MGVSCGVSSAGYRGVIGCNWKLERRNTGVVCGCRDQLGAEEPSEAFSCCSIPQFHVSCLYRQLNSLKTYCFHLISQIALSLVSCSGEHFPPQSGQGRVARTSSAASLPTAQPVCITQFRGDFLPPRDPKHKLSWAQYVFL